MLVVSDNSPLNLLVQLDLVSILSALFGRVLIPPEVTAEMCHPMAPSQVRAFIASPPPWPEIKSAKSSLSFPDLDPGESAAISLVLELNAPLMIDEQDGRAAALARGLVIVGAV